MRGQAVNAALAFGLLALACCLPASAEDQPLTLQQVLAYADRSHPDLDAAQARTDLARAGQMLAESQNDFRVTLDASLATGRNPMLHGFAADNFASLDARKLLWDGGRTGLANAAATLEATARQDQYLDVLAQRRLTLMTRFFDVLLTDMRYAMDSELTAVAYVNYDNNRDRQQVGEVSNSQLARLQAAYQDARLQRQDDLRLARIKRAMLANAMNRPGELPSDLADPKLEGNDRPLPELNDLITAMEAGNPRLEAQRQLLAAAQKRLEAQRAGTRPSLEFAAGTATYSRDTLSRDDLHFALNLIWPLYQGRQNDARIAQEQARFQGLQAEYAGMQLELREALRETYEEIDYLRNSARQAAVVNADYREKALDKARAEYELEMKTNLGTSMADIQAAQLRSKTVEYRLALAWERLAGLLGQPVESVKPAPSTEETK